MVSGFESLDDGEIERLRVCAAVFAGLVRKAREEVLREGEGERMELSWVIMAELRVCVVWRARFSFLDSCSFRRRRRIDSGVGDEGKMGSWRFWGGLLAVLFHAYRLDPEYRTMEASRTS